MRLATLCTLFLSMSTCALAQTKISATLQCGKASERHSLEVGDHKNHALVIAQRTCNWTKSPSIEGMESKSYTETVFSEIRGHTSRDQGYAVSDFANGDKTYVRFRGTTQLEDGKATGAQGTWNYTGGTGRLKGIKGIGTYSCRPDGDQFNCEIEGQYTLPER